MTRRLVTRWKFEWYWSHSLIVPHGSTYVSKNYKKYIHFTRARFCSLTRNMRRKKISVSLQFFVPNLHLRNGVLSRRYCKLKYNFCMYLIKFVCFAGPTGIGRWWQTTVLETQLKAEPLVNWVFKEDTFSWALGFNLLPDFDPCRFGDTDGGGGGGDPWDSETTGVNSAG